MAWTDRLKPEISLTSPTGQQFAAYWAGDQRSIEKKIGVFDYPGIVGSVAQDLDTMSVRYPLTFFFEGPDHDLIANRFFTACRERGVWSIVHPVHGTVSLQLMTITEDVQPVNSGNITRVSSEWMEPIDPSVVTSTAQLSDAVGLQITGLQDLAATQFADVVSLATPAGITAFKNAIEKAVAVVDAILSPMYSLSATVTSAVQSIKRGITSGLIADTLDVLGFAGQLWALVGLPGASGANTTDRISYYRAVISASTTVPPSTPTAEGLNAAAVHEIVNVAALAAIAAANADSNPESREQAIVYLEDTINAFSDMTASLDTMQALYAGNAIDVQYFSQSQSFNDSAIMIHTVAELLLRRSFDLAAARRFTLARYRAPVDIAAEKYGDLDHLDFFISSNGLKGTDILLLPPGREVVVYI